MPFLGFSLTRAKATGSLTAVPNSNRFGGWLGTIQESFAGAWQRNIECESTENCLAFSVVYACISLISDDISKLRIKLTERMPNGTWVEVEPGSPFLPVLRKPNRFQTRIQFLNQWVVSKLTQGNTYALKQRDVRGIVTALFILDPRLVTPLVADDGAVFYQLKTDKLAEIGTDVVVPASEIIHDRAVCLWHPLVGVSPIYACGASSTQGKRIQANSAKFFENMSRPSGVLSAPGAITDATAARLKAAWEDNFGGSKIGRLAVLGDGLKYEAMTIPAADAQLIEQLKWTVEDVARCFHMPLHKVQTGAGPTFNNIATLNQDYYSQCLQSLIESIELLLDEGLNLINVTGKTYGTELDLEGLLRMDPVSRADYNQKAIGAGYLSPNEARLKDNLAPVEGGDTPYLQAQNYSLQALNKRDAQADPFAASTTPPATDSAPALPESAGPSDGPPSAPSAGKDFGVGAEDYAFAAALIAKFTDATRHRARVAL